MARSTSRVGRLTCRLNRAEELLRAGDHDLSQWFVTTRNNRIARDHYRALARQQINRDRAKILDSTFEERYTTGYSFVRVPRFRQDAESWDDFTRAFATWVLFSARHKRRHANIVVRCCIDAHLCNQETGAEELLRKLRERWPELRDAITEASMALLDRDPDED